MVGVYQTDYPSDGDKKWWLLVFPVVMYGCESWSIKKVECRRMDAFKLWCCRRLLKVRCTARRSNHSILKEISPEYSLEGLMLKLKPQYSGHLTWRTDSLEKTLMLGKIEGGRRRGQQRMRSFDSMTDLMNMSLSELRLAVEHCGQGRPFSSLNPCSVTRYLQNPAEPVSLSKPQLPYS